ncbi:MAG: isoprenylcysteine carboxylmethyltransferase family protein [Porticoccaceae bacterium]|nr:isoprenylcysteine carboxylmethyltransferase family protein [Porticoccaceae bacterium]
MINIPLFTIFTLLLIFLSRRALRNPNKHGFYRFFAFEGILLIILLNHPYWTVEPFTPLHVFSWLLLLASIIFVVHALVMLKIRGGYQARDNAPENFAFENTVHIVEDGLYRFIRHPMYASLLLLAWGAFFKHVTPLTISLVLAVSALLTLTAKVEEKENILFFGEAYRDYAKRTRMFIPWLL